MNPASRFELMKKRKAEVMDKAKLRHVFRDVPQLECSDLENCISYTTLHCTKSIFESNKTFDDVVRRLKFDDVLLHNQRFWAFAHKKVRLEDFRGETSLPKYKWLDRVSRRSLVRKDFTDIYVNEELVWPKANQDGVCFGPVI